MNWHQLNQVPRPIWLPPYSTDIYKYENHIREICKPRLIWLICCLSVKRHSCLIWQLENLSPLSNLCKTRILKDPIRIHSGECSCNNFGNSTSWSWSENGFIEVNLDLKSENMIKDNFDWAGSDFFPDWSDWCHGQKLAFVGFSKLRGIDNCAFMF